MLRAQSQIPVETRLSPSVAPVRSPLLPTRRRLGPQHAHSQQQRTRKHVVARAAREQQPSEHMLDLPSSEGLHRAHMQSLTHVFEYPQLARWLRERQQEVISSPSLACLALVRAADLRHTLQLSLDDVSKTEEQIIDAIQAQEQCGEELLPLLRHSLPSLPIDTVAACAQAASLLGDSGYDEGFWYSLVTTVQRAALPSGHLPCKQEVQGLVFELLVTALARAGYYSPDVMSLLAKDIATAVGNVQEPGTLAAVVEAYMELQHLDQQLLTSIGRQLLQAGTQPTGGTVAGGGLVLGSLSGQEALQVTLAYAFFNVQNPAFYQVLLARASSVLQQRQQQLGEDDADEEAWGREVALLQLACTLKPGGLETAPAGARALLADEARRLGPQCREAAAEQQAAVWDEEQGQSTQQLIQFQGLELLATRQVTAILTLGPPPSEHTRPTEQQRQQQQQQQLQLQPELPVPCTLVDGSVAPWATVDVALPGPHKVGVVLLPPQAFCRNMARLRGSALAQLRGMQALGWAVWSVSVEDWTAVVEAAAAATGIQGGYEAASDLLAQWLVTVARAERVQILRRVQDAFGKPEGEDEVLEQLSSDRSSRANLQLLHAAFLEGLEQGDRESAAGFFSRLQGHVWEGLEATKANQLQKG